MWMVIFILPIVLFCWIRNLKNLAPLSAAANIAVFSAIVVVFYAEIHRLASSNAAVMKKESELVVVASPLGVVLFFGNAFVIFEGVGVVS